MKHISRFVIILAVSLLLPSVSAFLPLLLLLPLPLPPLLRRPVRSLPVHRTRHRI